MATLREDLQALVVENRELHKRAEANSRKIDRFSNQIQKLCEKRLEKFKVKILGDLRGGSATSTWDPSVLVYGHWDGHRIFTKIGGEWHWYDGYLSGGEAYGHKVVFGILPPFDPKDLEAACDELAQEIGIPVRIVEAKFVGKPKRLRSSDDLLASMPGAQIVAEGKIWSMGWDISDPWAVLRDKDGGIHLFYATNGHGFGFDVHVEPGQSAKSFFDLSEQEDVSVDGLSDNVRSLLTA